MREHLTLALDHKRRHAHRCASWPPAAAQDMRLTALGGANSELQSALAAEQARVEAMARQLALKDQVGGGSHALVHCWATVCLLWRHMPTQGC